MKSPLKSWLSPLKDGHRLRLNPLWISYLRIYLDIFGTHKFRSSEKKTRKKNLKWSFSLLISDFPFSGPSPPHGTMAGLAQRGRWHRQRLGILCPQRRDLPSLCRFWTVKAPVVFFFFFLRMFWIEAVCLFVFFVCLFLFVCLFFVCFFVKRCYRVTCFFFRSGFVCCVFFRQMPKAWNTTQVDKLVYRVIKQQSGSVDDGMLWDIVMTINVDWECSDSALFFLQKFK